MAKVNDPAQLYWFVLQVIKCKVIEKKLQAENQLIGQVSNSSWLDKKKLLAGLRGRVNAGKWVLTEESPGKCEEETRKLGKLGKKSDQMRWKCVFVWTRRKCFQAEETNAVRSVGSCKQTHERQEKKKSEWFLIFFMFKSHFHLFLFIWWGVRTKRRRPLGIVDLRVIRTSNILCSVMTSLSMNSRLVPPENEMSKSGWPSQYKNALSEVEHWMKANKKRSTE